jgi:hypothetical protein
MIHILNNLTSDYELQLALPEEELKILGSQSRLKISEES